MAPEGCNLRGPTDNLVRGISMAETIKTCPKCEEAKPHDSFGLNRSRRDGLSFACSACTRSQSRAWRAANPTTGERNRDRLAALYKDDPRRYLNYRYTSLYGITLDQYEALLAGQGGACLICREDPGDQRLAVDHDHGCCPTRKKSCGKCIRGLLCGRCNSGLGYFRDDPGRLLRAANYLAQ